MTEHIIEIYALGQSSHPKWEYVYTHLYTKQDGLSPVNRDLMPSHPKRGSVHAYLPLQTSAGLSSSPQLARLGIDWWLLMGPLGQPMRIFSCVRRGGLIWSLSLIPLGTPDFHNSMRDPSLQRPRQHAGYVYSQVGQPSQGLVPFSSQCFAIWTQWKSHSHVKQSRYIFSFL